MKITSAHGGGGKQTTDLIRGIFQEQLGNTILNQMEDAAVLNLPSGRIAFTTDSFVVKPVFFAGGDIGRLAVCGTVNDLLMRGAVPRYLSAGFILEEGLDTEDLVRIVRSMRQAADEAQVVIVAGDTKVVEGAGGLYINTSGIGSLDDALNIGANRAKDGDVVLISGFLGNHEACILSNRMGIENHIESDCAPLTAMVLNLINSGVVIHVMRDITRGGLATVLNEIAASSHVFMELRPDLELTDPAVGGFCEILGLDPLYMGNEGKIMLTVPAREAERALAIIQASPYGRNARLIGTVQATEKIPPAVVMKTKSGGTRLIDSLIGEGLPRIC